MTDDPQPVRSTIRVERIGLAVTEPRHGWIEVALRLGDFELGCAASTVLNDPLEELADFALFARDGRSGFRRVCFWTEPAGYALDVRPAQEPDVIITLWYDSEFAPPMVGHQMTRVYQCILPRCRAFEGIAAALLAVLAASTQCGQKLDGLRRKQKQLELLCPPAPAEG